MFIGTTIGRVTKDLEVQYSENNVPYIRFSIAVNKGYGDKSHTFFPQCWAFGQDLVGRLEKSTVRKGSLIMVTGDVDLVDFQNKTGGKGTTLKIYVWAWEFAPVSKTQTKEDPVSDSAKSFGRLEDFEIVNE